LCTNDDGIHARGLEILRQSALSLTDDVWVVAPEGEQSGASRALTLSAPLRVHRYEDRVFAVRGTPTDCVTMGVLELLEGKAPDLILSGINRGQNLAEDVTLSGTVAGALQGMSMGVPSVALSQGYGLEGRGGIQWDTAAHHAPNILRTLMDEGWPSDVVVNVNFPAVEPDSVKGTQVTRLGHRDAWHIRAERRVDLRGGEYFWLGFQGTKSTAHEGTDLAAIYDGWISVTPIHLHLTHKEARAKLSEAFAEPHAAE
jgi:5'-nucleotidase